MTFAMDPQVFGSQLITWVGVFTLVGMALGVGLMVRWAPALGAQSSARGPRPSVGSTSLRRDAYGVALGAMVWGFVGARLFHVVDFWDFYSGAPFQAFYVWSGGLSLWGGIIVGGAWGLWRARRRFALGRFADAAAVAGLAGIAVGRLGDFLVGERAATQTSLPWAVEYAHPDAEAFAAGASVHPVALYELLLVLAMIASLLYFRGTLGARWRGALWRAVPEGALSSAALAAYAVGSFVITSVRTSPTYLGLHQAQWAALAVLAVAAVYAWRARPHLERVTRSGGEKS